MMDLEYLRNTLGFDQSEILPETETRGEVEALYLRCSQCVAATINGVPCHEFGCPNRAKECKECGEMFSSQHNRHSVICDDCREEIEDESDEPGEE